jgi:hypothetical protein
MKQVWELHQWFVRGSRNYVGPYTWRTRLEFPRAWCRFMWSSLRDARRASLLLCLGVLLLPRLAHLGGL